MPEIGYTLSSEEHRPNDLVQNASRAEEVGFDFVSISDHYHPWIGQQGNSGFVWSTLGGIAQAVDDLDVGVGVTCPIIRIHPAIVAQAVATAASMLPGRFYFGVGTGENLNEHVTGSQWPTHRKRLSMLEESVDVMRKLWTGEQVTHYGDHYTVEEARLFTLPEETPPVCVSAYGPNTAEVAGRIGDGFWSVGPQDVVQTFEESGGEGPKLCQLSGCYAEDQQRAVETVHEHWPNTALAGQLATELRTPALFEQACQMVTEEDIESGSTITSPDPEEWIDSIQTALDTGYDHIYLHQIGPDQESFLQFAEEEILPSFR